MASWHFTLNFSPFPQQGRGGEPLSPSYHSFHRSFAGGQRDDLGYHGLPSRLQEGDPDVEVLSEEEGAVIQQSPPSSPRGKSKQLSGSTIAMSPSCGQHRLLRATTIQFHLLFAYFLLLNFYPAFLPTRGPKAACKKSSDNKQEFKKIIKWLHGIVKLIN